MTKILIGTVTYIIITMIVAYTWNLLLFREAYLSVASSAYREAPIMQLGMISMLLEGIALSVIFSMFYKGGGGISEGLVIGLLVGVFSFAYAAFVVTAKFPIEPVWKYAVLELGFGIIHFGAAGVILGFVFSRNS